MPPDFQPQPASSIDSEVGRWGNATSHISYDYGWYSNQLNETPERNRRECQVSLGGQPARLVTGLTRDGQYVAGAHWPNFDGGITADTATILTVVGIAADSTGYRQLLASLWSIQFRKQP